MGAVAPHASAAVERRNTFLRLKPILPDRRARALQAASAAFVICSALLKDGADLRDPRMRSGSDGTRGARSAPLDLNH